MAGKGRLGRTVAALAVGATLAGGALVANSASAIPILGIDIGGQAEKPRPLRALSTGRHSEIRKKVPISRQQKRKARVVMSLGLPPLRPRDRVEANAEAVASTTCIKRSPRCVGKRYGFSPRLGGQLVLAEGKHTTAGPTATAVSKRVALKCGQKRPNRNHHCPLTIGAVRFGIDDVGQLPCAADRCRLNFVMDASHPNARRGQVVVVGADRPDGRIAQGKGRVNALLKPPGRAVGAATLESKRRRVHSLPASFRRGYRVTHSQRIGSPKAGAVLVANAQQVTATGNDFPYFVSNAIIVTNSPTATRQSRWVKRWVSLNGTLTETNGFNCTPGPSGYQTPCLSRKAGIVRIRRNAEGPLYVNLISRTFPMLGQTRLRAHPRARVLRGGGIKVRRIQTG